MTVLGSREQLCIHTDAQVHHGRARDYACHSLRKKHACSHYTRVSGIITYLHQNDFFICLWLGFSNGINYFVYYEVRVWIAP